MRDDCARRDFLKYSLAAMAAPAVAPSASSLVSTAAAAPAAEAKPAGENLTAYQMGPHVWIRWNNHLLTAYRAHPTQKYPYFYPLAGPSSGVSLTAETALPWPHHRSLLFACDRVNGGNYWQSGFEAGQIISTGPSLGECTPQSAEILDSCQWRKPGESPVATDQRKFTVRVPGPALRLIDAEIKFTAVEDVTITKTNHSLFSIRAAVDITPDGGGTLLNSRGQSGEAETFGKPAEWCTYFGARQGLAADLVEGIALMQHPQNPFPDCPWFTRDYGFISPTPFNFIEEPWQLPAGQSIDLKYRVVLYAGTAEAAGLDEIYKTWIAE
jgi:hypothetical protein